MKSNPPPREEAIKLMAANPNLISRAHFGRYLVEAGVCKDLRSVFESYLVPGRPGYVDHRWATLGDSVRWILDAGGCGRDEAGHQDY